MKYTKLGNSGLEISKLCLGCMGFGGSSPGRHDWAIGEEETHPILEAALEAGINFFDTANAYSAGTSEEIVGPALTKMADRSEVVIATKVYFPMRDGRNARGLSRKSIMTEVDNSLRRLGTDYIDLYQIHRFDDRTPVEETMRALHDVVSSGKVRYIGASSMWAWQFAKMQHTAEMNGWTKFISMQNQYSLLQREEEREMMPLCADQGVGSIPWSPLARGRLTRDWDETTIRSESDRLLDVRFEEQRDRPTVERVAEVAAELGQPMARVAMAWVLANPVVAAPIVGVTKLHHLTDAVESLNIELSEDATARLTELYHPRSASF